VRQVELRCDIPGQLGLRDSHRASAADRLRTAVHHNTLLTLQFLANLSFILATD
jgi:hypothetical protein